MIIGLVGDAIPDEALFWTACQRFKCTFSMEPSSFLFQQFTTMPKGFVCVRQAWSEMYEPWNENATLNCYGRLVTLEGHV